MRALWAAVTAAALLASGGADAKDKKPVDPNKRVCRSEVPTGHVMAKTVCHTQAEWTQINEGNAAGVQAKTDMSRGAPPERASLGGGGS